MAHAKRDKAFHECETAQTEELRAKQEQTGLLREFLGADPPPGDAGPSLSRVRDALDGLFPLTTADEAGSVAKQLLEVAKSELAPSNARSRALGETLVLVWKPWML